MRLSGNGAPMPAGDTAASQREMMRIYEHATHFGCSTNVLRRVHDPVSLIGGVTGGNPIGGFVPWRSTG
jgi:hypothetical protein